ncbi:MAG: ADP-ribosylglycohydrolase family protein [Actinomycetia bacterium]|nr:ADP-ribosylglycohydrolase family protein [Actinomycetes bacterium]
MGYTDRVLAFEEEDAVERTDRIVGCLLGGAVGDALGAPTEFLAWSQIRSRYGDKGIVDLEEAYGRMGAITDDTQMTLFTVEGVLAALEDSDWTIGSVTVEVHRAYLRWLITQGVRPPIDPGPVLGLVENEMLSQRRAPGMTCLSALREATVLGARAMNDSKGCGGVMRTAPLGFLGEAAYKLGCRAAAVTHGHRSGWTSAGALAHLIHRLDQGVGLTEAIEDVVGHTAEDSDAEEVHRALVRAVDLSRVSVSGPPTPRELGEGWVGEEALAIAVWCALRHGDDPAQAVRVAANHSGDTDSTASITGQILGAFRGTHWLDEFDLANLELRDEIDTLAMRLAEAVAVSP